MLKPTGQPDLTAFTPAGVVFCEVKRESDKLNDEQRKWIRSALGAGAVVWHVRVGSGEPRKTNLTLANLDQF